MHSVICNASGEKKKAKCARRSESLPTGLLCNQYNPECDSKAPIWILPKFRGYLKQKNNRELMKNILLSLSAVVAVLLPLSQNAQAHWVYFHRLCAPITLLGSTAAGIMAIGMPGAGTPGCWF